MVAERTGESQRNPSEEMTAPSAVAVEMVLEMKQDIEEMQESLRAQEGTVAALLQHAATTEMIVLKQQTEEMVNTQINTAVGMSS